MPVAGAGPVELWKGGKGGKKKGDGGGPTRISSFSEAFATNPNSLSRGGSANILQPVVVPVVMESNMGGGGPYVYSPDFRPTPALDSALDFPALGPVPTSESSELHLQSGRRGPTTTPDAGRREAPDASTPSITRSIMQTSIDQPHQVAADESTTIIRASDSDPETQDLAARIMAGSEASSFRPSFVVGQDFRPTGTWAPGQDFVPGGGDFGATRLPSAGPQLSPDAAEFVPGVGGPVDGVDQLGGGHQEFVPQIPPMMMDESGRPVPGLMMAPMMMDESG